MKRLAGKVALVTGASRGIGRAIALKFAAEGATVVAHYGHSTQAAHAVAAELKAAGGQGFIVQADLTSTVSICAMFDVVGRQLAALGIDKLDILVNNAGVAVSGDVESTTEADFDKAFSTNVKGLLFVSQQAVPRLRDGGRIINLSSVVGHNAYPSALVYAATKAAVDSMTLSMAKGLGHRRITVNAIAPGATHTDFIADILEDESIVSYLQSQTALGEIGKASDIANVAVFLASDEASWITGERLRASGGMHL